MFTIAIDATSQPRAVPAVRTPDPRAANMRAPRAPLSARNASAVVGAMGMKVGDGVRKIDQPAAPPISTTREAAMTATLVRIRAARAVVISGPLKIVAGYARSRVTR